MKKLTTKDVTVSHSEFGGLNLLATVGGTLFNWRYFGYSKRECLRDFLKRANAKIGNSP